jgi:hypothetical protein
MANSRVAKNRRGNAGRRSTLDALLRNGSGGPSPKAPATSVQGPMKNGSNPKKQPNGAHKSIGQLKRSS